MSRPGLDSVARSAPGSTLAAAAALALALALVPLALHLPFDADRFLPLLFLPALALAWRLPAPPLPTWQRFALGTVAVAFVLSSLLARNHAAAAVTAAAAGLALGGVSVARRLAGSPGAVRLVLAGMLAGPLLGFALVRFGWGEDRMADFPTYWGARIFGAHAFSGALAGLGLLLLPGLSRPARALAALGTLGAWTALAWSGSRAPALGLAVALGVWFWRSTPPRRRALLLLVPVLGLLALACSRPLGTPYPQLGWWPALTRTIEARDAHSITSERTDYWSASWQQIRAAPLLGHGADAYRFLTPKQPGNQPHNTYLQWLLEYGLLGTLPLLALLAVGFRPLRHPVTSDEDPALALSRWAAAGVAGASVYAFFDGVAYHMVAMMPVAVIVGFASRSRPPEATPSGPVAPGLPARLLGIVATVLLLLHAWLGLLLLRGAPVAPDSIPARLLRAFPSTTHGMSAWIERWQTTHPEAAADWLAWAPTVSPDPARFHLQSAQNHLNAKNWVAAERELAAALDKVLLMERADVQRLLDEIRALVAKTSAPAKPAPDAHAP